MPILAQALKCVGTVSVETSPVVMFCVVSREGYLVINRHWQQHNISVQYFNVGDKESLNVDLLMEGSGENGSVWREGDHFGAFRRNLGKV